MTDDRIVRMLRVSESDPVQQEAADKIERLRAQLDEACEALEPFAAIADIYEIDALSVGDLETFIDVVELRRARAVHEKIKGGGDE